MITLQDEIESRGNILMLLVIVIGVAAVVGVTGGVVKVKNELQMTKAYDRQAAALERIAAKVDTMSFSHVTIKRQEETPVSFTFSATEGCK